MFNKRLAFFRSLFYLADLFLVLAAWLAAYYVRFFAPIIPVTKGVPDLELYLGLLVLVLIVFSIVFQVSGLYKRPWAPLTRLLWPLFRATTVGVVVSIAIAWFAKPYEFSRLVFVHFWAFLTAVLVIYRPLLQGLWIRQGGERAGEGVIIVGAEDLGRRVARKLMAHPELGMRVEGFLSGKQELVGQERDGLPVLGLYADINRILSEHPVSLVIIALPLSAHDRILDVLNNIADELVDVKVVPDLFQHVSLSGSVEEFDGIPFIGLRGSPMEGWARVAKRATDLVGSLAGIILLSPLLALLAVTVKLSSPGPVLYKQKRMGLDGKVFTMLKFRSMRIDAEKDCGPVWACADDPRRTRLGTFMRRTSLDELPQLWNTLKGEMSLVGPRPERPEFISQFKSNVPRYMLRHKMKAGITGWAQINGWRGNTSLERRIDHDLYYIEHWSLGLDFKIMLLTLVRGLIHPNAY